MTKREKQVDAIVEVGLNRDAAEKLLDRIESCTDDPKRWTARIPGDANLPTLAFMSNDCLLYFVRHAGMRVNVRWFDIARTHLVIEPAGWVVDARLLTEIWEE